MKYMNILRLTAAAALLAVLAAAPACAQGIIEDFSAEADGQTVILQWNTGRETGVTGFEIQRSFDGNRFFSLTTVDPSGDGKQYRYVDDDLYKDRLQKYYYRIETTLRSGRSQFSDTAEVSVALSGIYRSWGSIKAMFR